MQRLFITALACLSFFSIYSQNDTRLALVIGNSNYEQGELKNPVHDALLVAKTLESLDFEVILDTNITDKLSFTKTIRDFGEKRANYDVAFVYYAGHGIQINSENYLLPTHETFKQEFDVIDFGVSVQSILRYLNGVTNKVNILVLDACRNNPFEYHWDAKRSVQGGKGLAKIPPPTGSIIAFSTEAGNTASDGQGENSVYCESLCRNMLLPNISLDQLFRNVRSDVLNATQDQQRPIEASQLTGQTYYLLKREDYSKIDVNEISVSASEAIKSRDFKNAIDYLTLLEVYYKSNLNYENKNKLANIYLELGRCNIELHASEPNEFYNSMYNAGKWDEIAYEEYIRLSDKYLNYASDAFLNSKNILDEIGINEKNKINYSEAFYKYLRAQSYLDYAKRGIDENAFIRLITELNEYNLTHFGMKDIKTACSHYLLGLFIHEQSPLEAYSNFQISSEIFNVAYTNAEDVNKYAISFDIIFPYKWSLLALNSVFDTGMDEDNYYDKDKGKEVADYMLDYFGKDAEELYQENIEIINQGLSFKSISNDLDGLIIAANEFTHYFPLFFDLNKQNELECLDLTVKYNNMILSFENEASYLDSIRTLLNNSVTYSNYLITDKKKKIRSIEILEKMILCQTDAFKLAIDNNDGAYAISALNDYMESFYYYKDESSNLKSVEILNMIDAINPLFQQTLRNYKEYDEIEFLAEYFLIVSVLIEDDLIKDDTIVSLVKKQEEFYNFIYD